MAAELDRGWIDCVEETMSEQNEWVWSHDGERFNGGPEDSREAAIEQALSEGARFVGRKIKYHAFGVKDLTSVLLEDEGERAYECVGEVADSWPPPVSPEKAREATAKIAAIMIELTGLPWFYAVEDVQELPASEPENTKGSE